MTKRYVLLLLISFMFLFAGCSEPKLKREAKNETWTEEIQVYEALQEAKKNKMKNYYFLDLRTKEAHNEAFIQGFLNKPRDKVEFSEYVKNIKKYAMIVIYSESTEFTMEMVAFLIGLDFINVKGVMIPTERLFEYFHDKGMIMKIDEGGNTCPVDGNGGC